MSKVPAINGKKAIKAFRQFGFYEVRRKGSHVTLVKEGYPLILTIPDHGNTPLKRGLLRCQIRAAGLTVDEFVKKL
jgi:predicted RNA binding protein YcfA (HicA-like mRNA interferase family)